MIDPALVNNSSVSMNILNLFDVLRLSQASVPVIWIDGFATDEISGACMRAAGVQFTALQYIDILQYIYRTERINNNERSKIASSATEGGS